MLSLVRGCLMPHRIKPGQLDRIPFAASQIENVDKALTQFINRRQNKCTQK